MYTTLSHALLDLTGLDWPVLKFLNSFGFFVAVAFFFASWTLSLELRRKEGLGLLQPVTKKITTVVGGPAISVGPNLSVDFQIDVAVQDAPSAFGMAITDTLPPFLVL